ncbi:MAG: thymidine kinase [Arenicellales bacterium]|jgi:thymidine kinase|nr:thymidine kinase [Acidiferrobacteraceae bacterium]MDP6122775.1 thymidine kinase [Arenicellales bacterium]MDP6435086.1 thymidine kinase [Arenicellales bacterium]MDP6672171.1 thymidine kinase [Arenicellales bacterium]MDP6724519.1 thymidine kinase [Arenicellales bacterium]|tara:strand:+ start:5520 stop:6098 length:579 start_codon:yes stop_codon:yes gene_type:complete
MAKLYFHYAAMNAGKTTSLLQVSHNYRELEMNTLLLTPQLDDRADVGKIASRIGLEATAEVFTHQDNLFELVNADHSADNLSCILVDEAQFLSKEQVWQLARVVDDLDIPVMCYGLRTDFQGELFPGSARLLAVADVLKEIKTVCHCGRKAIMVIRLGADGKAIKEGAQIEIGGNEKYISLCRAHWRESVRP